MPQAWNTQCRDGYGLLLGHAAGMEAISRCSSDEGAIPPDTPKTNARIPQGMPEARLTVQQVWQADALLPSLTGWCACGGGVPVVSLRSTTG